MKSGSMWPSSTQQVQQAVEQGEVGARRDLQEQVGLVGGGGAARVDDDQLGARLDPLHHPQEQDRVAVGHVGADDEEDVGVVEVLVRAGRAVRAERQLVAGARAGHAQPGVRLDLVGAARSPWPACSPGTAPPGSSARRRRRRPRPGPCSSTIARSRRAVSVIAASRPASGTGSAPRSGRTRAVVSRPGAASMSAVVAPLVHSRPKFAGCALSPDALSTVRRPSGPAPTSSTMPQPTPQYEQTVRTTGTPPGPRLFDLRRRYEPPITRMSPKPFIRSYTARTRNRRRL